MLKPIEEQELSLDSIKALADTVPVPVRQPAPATAPDPFVASSLGKYRITGKIGAGGMGVVYQAQDTLLKRPVAIKLLPESVSADPEALRRLLREAQLAARLNHPHVVAVYEIDQHEGAYYIVMELVEGGSAEDVIRSQGPFPWREATRVIAATCRGLMAAHEAGLIHRDIKPANILLQGSGISPSGIRDQGRGIRDQGSGIRDQGASLTVKLADFGLAKATDQLGTSIIGAGHIAGTPDYMSPEQCGSERLDGRSDIYSLGATYYALLAGKPPYPGSEPVQIMFAHCSNAIPDPRAGNPDIPASCTEIVQRAMAKEPIERYQTAAEMLADLEVVLREPAGLVAPARRGSKSTRKRRSSPATAPTRVPAPVNESLHSPAWRRFAIGVLGVAAFLGAMLYFQARSKVDNPPRGPVPDAQEKGDNFAWPEVDGRGAHLEEPADLLRRPIRHAPFPPDPWIEENEMGMLQPPLHPPRPPLFRPEERGPFSPLDRPGEKGVPVSPPPPLRPPSFPLSKGKEPEKFGPVTLTPKTTRQLDPGTHRPEILVTNQGEIVLVVVQPELKPLMSGAVGQVKHRAYRYRADWTPIANPFPVTQVTTEWGEPADHRATLVNGELVVVYQTLVWKDGKPPLPLRKSGPAEFLARDQSLILARFTLDGKEILRQPIVAHATDLSLDNFPDHCLLWRGDRLLVSTGSHGGTLTIREVDLQARVLATHTLKISDRTVPESIGNSFLADGPRLFLFSASAPQADAVLSTVELDRNFKPIHWVHFHNPKREQSFPTGTLMYNGFAFITYLSRERGGSGDPRENPYQPYLKVLNRNYHVVKDYPIGTNGFAHVHPTIARLGNRLFIAWSKAHERGPVRIPQVWIEEYELSFGDRSRF